MINFVELEQNISNTMAQQRVMASSLARLETTLAALADKSDVQAMEARFKQQLKHTSASLERLDTAQKGVTDVIEAMPKIKSDLTRRMEDLGRKLSGDVSTMEQKIGERCDVVEHDTTEKVLPAEFKHWEQMVDDCERTEVVNNLQELVNKIRDQMADRIESIGERTRNMGRDLSGNLGQINATIDVVQKRVDERTTTLGGQSTDVSAFLAKADRQLSAKVDESGLKQAKASMLDELGEARNALQARLGVMNTLIERSIEDFGGVVGKVDAAATHIEVWPISEKVKNLEKEMSHLYAEVGTKASAKAFGASVSDFRNEHSDQKAEMRSKADDAKEEASHEQRLKDSAIAFSYQNNLTKNLAANVKKVEGATHGAAAILGKKVEKRDMLEMKRMSDATHEQVASLKEELQGTLKSLETWILAQNTVKTNGMQLQPKPPDGKNGAKFKGATPAPARPAHLTANEKLQHRVSALERQLSEMQEKVFEKYSDMALPMLAAPTRLTNTPQAYMGAEPLAFVGAAEPLWAGGAVVGLEDSVMDSFLPPTGMRPERVRLRHPRQLRRDRGGRP